MEKKIYVVSKIDGEYAYLAEEGTADSDELFIAIALLPMGVDVGTRLIYDFPNFEIL